MRIIQKIINRHKRVFSLLLRKIGKWLPDRIYLRMMYYIQIGKVLNLERPTYFNEKLQWLKLYDRRPEYTKMVDKYAVKEYVSNIIGKEYIISTLGVWNAPEEISWDMLPNSFVLKTTHGGGGKGVIICRDKTRLDIPETIKRLQKAMRQDVYYNYREWPYRNVRHRIIAEEYMISRGREGLADYKVHCFNGIPKIILVCRNRFKDRSFTSDFYSTDWKHLDLKRPSHDNPGGIEPPEKLQTMLKLAEKLSAQIPFIRVDFYIVENRIYFGELTFFPASGLTPFVPESYDKLFGDWLIIPEARK